MQLEPESVYRMLRGKKIGLHVYIFSSVTHRISASIHLVVIEKRRKLSAMTWNSCMIDSRFLPLWQTSCGRETKQKQKTSSASWSFTKVYKIARIKNKKDSLYSTIVTIIYDQASSWTQKRRMLPDNSLVPSLYL